MASYLTSLINPVQDFLRDYLLNHARYIIQVGGNVKALGDNVNLLERKRIDVENTIIAEERGTLKKATNEVKGWLDRVDDILHMSREIEEAYNKRNCMLCSCSFNCFSNHNISMRAIEELQHAKEELKHIDETKAYTSELVPPSVQEMPTTSTAGGQLELYQQQALKFLREDSRGVLGIWGMGGVGKTTLLEHINNSLVADPFLVIYVVASKECTIEKIQDLVAMKLGLPKEGNHFQGIYDCLKDKNFVILLDDLWEPIDLNNVGIPSFSDVTSKCKRKLILTTRSYHVCCNMGAGNNTINVECLKWEEAWALFRANVGEGVIESDPQIATLAKKAAGECGGLPLALITVGRAMAGNRTPEVWENVVNSLKKSRLSDIPGTNTQNNPLQLLKTSYDYLKDCKMQECFLHCALWPEDYNIPKVELIECWMGHGFLDEFDDIHVAYNSGHTIIDSLVKACLLQHVDRIEVIEPCLIIPSVKMHDLVRDMALWVARECGANEKKWIVLAGVGLKEAPQDERTWSSATTKISLMNNGIEKLPSRRLDCPNLTTLMLQRNHYSAFQGSSIQYFPALRYLDMSSCHLTSNLSKICQLHNLEYLNLSYNSGIEKIPEKLKNLTNLKYLLLRRCGIHTLPKGLLPNLKMLLVLDVWSHSVGFGGGNYPQTQIIDQLDCVEGRLKSLGITTRSASDLEKLARSCIPVTSLSVNWIDGFPLPPLLADNFLGSKNISSNLKSLEITCRDGEELVVEGNTASLTSCESLGCFYFKEIIWKGVEPRTVLPKLREVKISSCESKHVTWLAYLPYLQYLYLASSENMTSICERVVAGPEEKDNPAFPRLRVLVLRYLPKLGTIGDAALAFPSLELLHVNNCEQLKKLPSCSKLKKITGHKKWWEGVELDDQTKASLPFQIT